MIFMIKSAHKDANVIIASGFLRAKTEDEKEVLEIMVDEFHNIKTYNDKFTTNGKSILFKGVELGLLKQTLGYLAKTLDLDITYEIADNFVGDKKLRALLN